MIKLHDLASPSRKKSSLSLAINRGERSGIKNNLSFLHLSCHLDSDDRDPEFEDFSVESFGRPTKSSVIEGISPRQEPTSIAAETEVSRTYDLSQHMICL